MPPKRTRQLRAHAEVEASLNNGVRLPGVIYCGQAQMREAFLQRAIMIMLLTYIAVIVTIALYVSEHP